jgi:hypothetical protein
MELCDIESIRWRVIGMDPGYATTGPRAFAAAVQAFKLNTEGGPEQHCVIVNTSDNQGRHWVTCVMSRNAQQEVTVVVYEPLCNDTQTGCIKQELEGIGVVPVVVVLGWQQDGWQCGYFCLWVLFMWHRRADPTPVANELETRTVPEVVDQVLPKCLPLANGGVCLPTWATRQPDGYSAT